MMVDYVFVSTHEVRTYMMAWYSRKDDSNNPTYPYLLIIIAFSMSVCRLQTDISKNHFPQLDRNWTPLHFLLDFSGQGQSRRSMDLYLTEMGRGNPPSSFWRTTSTRPKTRWSAAWRKPVWLGARVERNWDFSQSWEEFFSGFPMGDNRNGWFIVENDVTNRWFGGTPFLDTSKWAELGPFPDAIFVAIGRNSCLVWHDWNPSNWWEKWRQMMPNG